MTKKELSILYDILRTYRDETTKSWNDLIDALIKNGLVKD